MFLTKVAVVAILLTAPSALIAQEYYWAVALRTIGHGHAMGTGITMESAKADALARCKKKRSVGLLVQKCRVVAVFSSEEEGCVSVINGGERDGAGTARNFYTVSRSVRNSSRADVSMQCSQARKRSPRSWSYDCRGLKSYCGKDALYRFRYGRE